MLGEVVLDPDLLDGLLLGLQPVDVLLLAHEDGLQELPRAVVPCLLYTTDAADDAMNV